MRYHLKELFRYFRKGERLPSRATIRTRFLNDKGMIYKCSCCHVSDEWQGLPLTLELHHINGKRNDNRLSNLTWLCPNCHVAVHVSQRLQAKMKGVKV